MDELKSNIKLGTLCLALGLAVTSISSCGGGGEDTSPTPTNNNQNVVDRSPASFSFDAYNEQPLSVVVESNSITVSDINTNVNISIENGEYSVNSAPYTNLTNTVKSGDKVKIRHMTAAKYNAEQSSTLTIGDVKANFVSVTLLQPADNQAPVATLSFPLSSTISAGETIIVKGEIEDESDIVEVIVNDQVANLETNKTPEKSRSFWSSKLTANQFGEIAINITAKDAAGNIAKNENISSVSVPLILGEFDVNPDTGDIYTVKDSKLYRINVENKSVEQLSESREAFASASIYYDNVNKKIISLKAFQDQVEIFSTNISPNGILLIDKILDNSEIYSSNEILTARAYSQSMNKLALGFLTINSNQSKVLEIDLSTGEVSTFYQTNAYGTPYELLYTEHHLLSRDGTSLQVFDAKTKEHLSSKSILGFDSAMTTSDDPYAIYIADETRVYKFNLLNDEATIYSQLGSGSLDALQQLRKIYFDKSNHRLIINEDTVVGLLSFDLISQQFNKYYTGGRGDGPKLVAPRAIDLSADGKYMYVFDDGANAYPALYKVEIATGNRTLLKRLEKSQVYIAQDLKLNERKGQLYFLSNNTIYRLDLASFHLDVFDDTSSNDKDVYVESMNAMTIDEENQDIYIVDNTGSKIVKIDIDSKQRTLIALALYNGSVIARISDIEYRQSNNSLLLLSQQYSELFEYSMADVRMNKVLDYCKGKFGDDILTEQSSASEMAYQKVENAVYIQADTLLKYNFDSQICEPTGGNNVFFNLDLTFDQQGRLFTTDFTKLKQVDFSSGHEVVISQY